METTIQLDSHGVMAEAVGPEHGITVAEWEGIRPLLSAAQERLRARRAAGKLGFADLPLERGPLDVILPAAQQVRYRFDHVVVLGIGGSALGLRALQEALLNASETTRDRLDRRSMPTVHVCDNIDPDGFEPLLQQLDWKKTLVNVISKSGKTSETGAQFLIVRDLLERKFGSERWKEHIVVTTDPASGPLRAMVICEGLQSFSVPPNVGGRFSCLTPVGLFPAACAGIDVVALLDGARAMAEACFAASGCEGLAAQLAAVHFLLDTRHAKPISVLMPYRDCLQRFADWYVQLHAESIGKDGKGQTPLRALGATDQHSVLQLFVDGPNNKMITLLDTATVNCALTIPRTDEPVFSFMGGRNLFALLQAEAEATRIALREAQRPVLRLTLPRIDAPTIGGLLFAYEWMIALLGELYEVNAFDQPGVERGKVLTRELLQR
ncbi:MAG: glucose-6-phosphate isomerase [Deltaproteobacteria bacterium]|nr:glucose-6-phosphate isomerase [Deltaproteobacteria bacterium]